jgi:hypothetical protein
VVVGQDLSHLAEVGDRVAEQNLLLALVFREHASEGGRLQP